MILALLPFGRAWARSEGSNLSKLAQGAGESLEEVDRRSAELLDELDPSSTAELVRDWERVLGLPDECAGAGSTLSERRDFIVAKLVGLGGQRAADLIALAALFGYTITIEEISVSNTTVGEIEVGDYEVAADTDAHHFIVHSEATPTFDLEAGDIEIDTELGYGGVDALECLINRHKPAHTSVSFVYDL